MLPEDEANLAGVWIQYAAEQRDEDFWAWDRLTSLVLDQPEQAWPILHRIIADAPEVLLGYIGAGPLENLLSEHSAEFGERIADQARRDARFRAALSAVWLSHGEISPTLEARLQQLTGGKIRIRFAEP